MFTRAQWFTLPLSLRQRWWRETDYSRNPPSPELALEIELFFLIQEAKRELSHRRA